jgi:general secretion pathway protein J
MNRRGQRRARGMTLFEVLIAMSVLAMVSILIYQAFAGMQRSKQGLRDTGDRWHEGRAAMQRMARELQGAYVSGHAILNPLAAVQKTAFLGERGTPAARLSFNAFVHRRLDRDAHESDQAEISYFGGRDPKRPGVTDLLRRESALLDLEPDRGGRVQVLATDIDLFDAEYLDPLSGQWVDGWDTTQVIGQPNRLPLQARLTLVLNGGRRGAADRARDTIRLVTKVPIEMRQPLSFATQ